MHDSFDSKKREGKNAVPATVDKPLPHNLTVERAFLGSVILSGRQFVLTRGQIAPEMFYNPAHKIIWETLCGLYDTCPVAEDGSGVDLVLLAEELIAAGRLEQVGGEGYLKDIIRSVATPEKAIHYTTVLREKYKRRCLIEFSSNMTLVGLKGSGSLDPRGRDEKPITTDEMIGYGLELLSALSLGTQNQGAIDFEEGLSEHLESFAKNDEGYPIDPRLSGLDRFTHGLKPGRLYVIAARPKAGKSTLSRQLALYAAKQNVGTVIYSYEMTKRSILELMASHETKIPWHLIEQGNLTPDQVTELKTAMQYISGFPLWATDSILNLQQLKSDIARLKALYPELGIVIVDYCQLVPVEWVKGETRERAVAKVIETLKLIAVEQKVAMIALAQLSRESEADRGEPQARHLRESGAIEQVLDFLLIIHPDPKFQASPGCMGANLLIKLNRWGQTGRVPVILEGATGTFTERSDVEAPRLPTSKSTPFGETRKDDEDLPF